jgi:alanine racemase
MNTVSWVDISVGALRHNVQQLQRAAGPRAQLCVMVKGNGYGHGLLTAAQAFVAAGVPWLGVADLPEIEALRAAGVEAALYVVAWLPPHQIARAVALDARFVLYDRTVLQAAAAAAQATGRTARVHVKIETGNNRQGLRHAEAVDLCREVAATPGVELEGLTTHFADIEDTTDHGFARTQLARFRACVDEIRAVLGLPPEGHPDDRLLCHCSNSAAILLWPEVCGRLARCGIAAYGLWPSKETRVSVRELGREPLALEPALTWKTRIAQVREVPAGEWVGYGRTWRAVRATRLAILPVGYHDGYDRRLSNLGKVLVGGWRAPVIGRVAMNMTAVDVTDRPEARAGDEVVLLGSQGDERVSAEEMAGWLGTIHYEVVTRIGQHLPRRLVG